MKCEVHGCPNEGRAVTTPFTMWVCTGQERHVYISVPPEDHVCVYGNCGATIVPEIRNTHHIYCTGHWPDR